jgi:hypothetical protein
MQIDEKWKHVGAVSLMLFRKCWKSQEKSTSFFSGLMQKKSKLTRVGDASGGENITRIDIQ